MKKVLLRIGVGIVILFILAVLCISLFLDGAVKRGVEAIGSRLTQVDVKLDKVSLSPLSGSGEIQGLVVGNPQPYKTPHAIQIGKASLSLVPGSLLSRKIVVKSIDIESPEITFEGGFGGNNLSKILANVRSSEATESNAPAAKPSAEKPGKNFEVDDLRITGAKLSVSVTGMGGKTFPVTIPDIHLTDLGKDSNGITSAELVKVVLGAIEKGAIQAADKSVADLSKSVNGLSQDAGKSATGAVDKIRKGLGDLFKKK
jgi:hypothetical protein